jgi:hypothetical protein
VQHRAAGLVSVSLTSSTFEYREVFPRWCKLSQNLRTVLHPQSRPSIGIMCTKKKSQGSSTKAVVPVSCHGTLFQTCARQHAMPLNRSSPLKVDWVVPPAALPGMVVVIPASYSVPHVRLHAMQRENAARCVRYARHHPCVQGSRDNAYLGAGTPDVCAPKTVSAGVEVCMRRDAVVTPDTWNRTIWALDKANQCDYERAGPINECARTTWSLPRAAAKHDAMTAGHAHPSRTRACRECTAASEAMLYLSGCSSCKADLDLFVTEYTSICVRQPDQQACTSLTTKAEVDALLCEGLSRPAFLCPNRAGGPSPAAQSHTSLTAVIAGTIASCLALVATLVGALVATRRYRAWRTATARAEVAEGSPKQLCDAAAMTTGLAAGPCDSTDSKSHQASALSGGLPGALPLAAKRRDTCEGAHGTRAAIPRALARPASVAGPPVTQLSDLALSSGSGSSWDLFGAAPAESVVVTRSTLTWGGASIGSSTVLNTVVALPPQSSRMECRTSGDAGGAPRTAAARGISYNNGGSGGEGDGTAVMPSASVAACHGSPNAPDSYDGERLEGPHAQEAPAWGSLGPKPTPEALLVAQLDWLQAHRGGELLGFLKCAPCFCCMRVGLLGGAPPTCPQAACDAPRSAGWRHISGGEWVAKGQSRLRSIAHAPTCNTPSSSSSPTARFSSRRLPRRTWCASSCLPCAHDVCGASLPPAAGSAHDTCWI